MVVATALWGLTFIVIRDSLGALDAQVLVLGRFALAGALFTAVALVTRRSLSREQLGWGALSGFLAGLCFWFQAVGMQWTTAGSSAFLTCAGSMFPALIAWPLLRQRPGGRLLSGLALAFVGAALLSLDASFRLGRGEWITFVSALGYAASIVAVGRLGAAFDPIVVAAVQSWAIVLMTLGAAPRALEQLPALTAPGWTRFLYLALAGSFVAPLLQLVALRRLPPGRVGLLLALEPVFALVFSVTIGGEHFVGRWWIGAALILSAVMLVEWPASAGRARPSATG